MKKNAIPKTVASLALKLRDKIKDIQVEDDNFEPASGPYSLWIYLEPGYYSQDPGRHLIHEATAKDAIDAMKQVQACDCAECEELIAKKAAQEAREVEEMVGLVDGANLPVLVETALEEEVPEWIFPEIQFAGVRTAEGARVVANGDPLPLRLDLANHSPSGFEWGFGGSGPSQLALAILAEMLPEEQALDLYMRFKWEVVADLRNDAFVLESADIADWIRSKWTEEEASGHK